MITGLQNYADKRVVEKSRIKTDCNNYLKRGKGVGGAQAPEITDDDTERRGRP